MLDKYIVTGGAGFIGSHISKKLLNLGYDVVVIDDLSTGFLDYLPEERFNLPDGQTFTFLKLDISNWSELSKHFSYFKGAQGIFHCAAKARIQPSISAPHETHQSNVDGTLNILEMMRMCDIPNIVYSASSSCYGLKTTEIASHESDYISCQTPYAVTKYMGELYCETWARLHKINVRRLRYFNVWGPRSPLGGPYAPVISKFFAQCQSFVPMTVVGDGQQRRDFTFVSDVVEANIAAMTKMVWYKSGINEIYNIGTGINHSILEIAKKIQKFYPNSSIIHVPERIGEAKTSLADNSSAQKGLLWKPQVTLDEGLKILHEYFKAGRA